MVRTILTPIAAPSANAAALQLLAFTAWDSGNGNRFRATGKEQLIVANLHATLAKTVTITSVADPYGRLGSITAQSLAAVSYYISQVFPTVGWAQTDGYIYCDGETTDIKFAVITQL